LPTYFFGLLSAARTNSPVCSKAKPGRIVSSGTGIVRRNRSGLSLAESLVKWFRYRKSL